MNNLIRLSKKQEKAQKLLDHPIIKERLSFKAGSLKKLIDENDGFVLSMCEMHDNEQDLDELADTLLRYVDKQKKVLIYKIHIFKEFFFLIIYKA